MPHPGKLKKNYITFLRCDRENREHLSEICQGCYFCLITRLKSTRQIVEYLQLFARKELYWLWIFRGKFTLLIFLWCIKTSPRPPQRIYIYIGASCDYPKNGCKGDYTPLLRGKTRRFQISS